ncbi:putative GTP-binding protein EngB [Daldinia childiae]|uniref:putative GTP-binding protein EngB n=1 Tax=Daldinia childiae TaxID=326645 RepID=UPI001448A21D|nr:putative GTP-binding protein EngB [Daldinia childiae]KAF3068293.1 putative GTP-binding protein EngB [Daldinia childiae]
MSLSNQLNAFLAMPPSLRLAVIGAPPRIRPSQARLALKAYRSTAAWNYDEAAAFYIPDSRQGRVDNVSLETLCKTSHMRSTPDEPLLSGLSTLFTRNPATFQYGETDFYKLKKNTLIPEVCVLGRSNVGKSSFVNALAGRSQRSQNSLARISKHAGKTREMNTYGFGPAPLPKDIAAWTAELKGKEDIPTHTFYLVDMPGYGHASLEDWGRNITLYLTKRIGVKGAIILIDAEVGPKELDLQCLQLLSSVNMRTSIVLTKADKVKGGLLALGDLCAKLRDNILDIEKSQENYNWNLDRDVFVTALGARDAAVIHSTALHARFAVARLAGLIETNRPDSEKNEKWSGKVISFEDLQYAPKDSLPKKVDNSESSKLEWAAGRGHEARHGITSGIFSSLHSRIITQPQARSFHSDSCRMKDPRNMEPDSQEMVDILDEFMKKIRATNTTSSYVRNMRRKNDRRLPPAPEKRNILGRQDEKLHNILKKRFPEDVARSEKIREKRLTGRNPQGGREQKANEEEWPTDFPSSRGKSGKQKNELMTPDAFKALVTQPESKNITPPSSGQTNKKKQKGQNNPGKKQSKQKEKVVVDEFEAKFAKAFSGKF